MRRLKARVFCPYSKSVVSYLKSNGVNVQRIENLLDSGYNVSWIHFGYFNGAEWKHDMIGGIHHKSNGFLVDNYFFAVTESNFMRIVLDYLGD